MNRICALGTSLYDGNLRHLCGANDGHVRVGMVATRHHSSLVRECRFRAESLGEPIRWYYECWPTTIAANEDPTGADLYRWIAYLARRGDNFLKMSNGQPALTDWGRDFAWLDMRIDATPAKAGPFHGKRPFEWLPDAVAQWHIAQGQNAYDGLLFDGYPLRLADVWLGGQLAHMPDGWRESWAEGATDALARIRETLPVICALDDRFFPAIASTDGGMIEDFGFRRSLRADLWGLDRYSLRMADHVYRKRDPRPPIVVKLHGSTTDAQLPALVCAASMVDDVYLSWYRPGVNGHQTVLNQLEAIERLQPYREMPVASRSAMMTEIPGNPELLRARRKLDDGRTLELKLPEREVRGL